MRLPWMRSTLPGPVRHRGQPHPDCTGIQRTARRDRHQRSHFSRRFDRARLERLRPQYGRLDRWGARPPRDTCLRRDIAQKAAVGYRAIDPARDRAHRRDQPVQKTRVVQREIPVERGERAHDRA